MIQVVACEAYTSALSKETFAPVILRWFLDFTAAKLSRNRVQGLHTLHVS